VITAISRGIEKLDGNQIADSTPDRALALQSCQKSHLKHGKRGHELHD
jgi:hypothetical protein